MRPILTTNRGGVFSDLRQTITNQYFESQTALTVPAFVLSIVVQTVSSSKLISFSFLWSGSSYNFNAPAGSYVTQLFTHEIESATPDLTIGNLLISFVSRLDQIICSTCSVAQINNLNENENNTSYRMYLNSDIVSLQDYYPEFFIEDEPEP